MSMTIKEVLAEAHKYAANYGEEQAMANAKTPDEYEEDLIKRWAIVTVSTHTEHDGSYCDTGEDMDWSCRSECVDMAIGRINQSLNQTEPEDIWWTYRIEPYMSRKKLLDYLNEYLQPHARDIRPWNTYSGSTVKKILEDFVEFSVDKEREYRNSTKTKADEPSLSTPPTESRI